MLKRLRNRQPRMKRFINDIARHTPFKNMVLVLVVSWIGFSCALYFAERGSDGATITSLGEALYWGVAAFTTAGIADTPTSALAQLLGGLWIVFGSALFFGTIVATITTYFMRPMQRPHKMIIDAIEYNLEQINDLSAEELDLLRETVDTLIAHVEQVKERRRKPR